jgi:hypothetical protein
MLAARTSTMPCLAVGNGKAVLASRGGEQESQQCSNEKLHRERRAKSSLGSCAESFAQVVIKRGKTADLCWSQALTHSIVFPFLAKDEILFGICDRKVVLSGLSFRCPCANAFGSDISGRLWKTSGTNCTSISSLWSVGSPCMLVERLLSQTSSGH